MDPQTFKPVWYLCGDSIWRIFRLLAYQDVGELTVTDSQLEFKSAERHIVINRLRRVSYGKQGRDFINNWVKVEFDEGNTHHKAFFAAGGSLGWDGVFGGTKRIFESVKRLVP